MFDLKAAIGVAQTVTFLTGAGVSTLSGIPDYRSKGGLYSGMKRPEDILSVPYLQEHPAEFHQWVTHNMYFPEAKPNVVHEKMAAISNVKGSVITQNVDGLDARAGTKHLTEFHGNLYRVYCTNCGKTSDYTVYLHDWHCPYCGGILRPDIVLYGEQINQDVLASAVNAVRSADLIIVVGSSLVVYPFAGLLDLTRSDAQIVAVNKERLELPQGAVMLQGDAATLFATL